MRVLVSVRSAPEAGTALEGGAEIIDAKEPAHGSLGAVAPEVLLRIARAVPPSVGLSAALGDARTPDEAVRAVTAVPAIGRRPAPFYLKLGFAGVRDAATVGTAVAAAVAAARRRDDHWAIVGVAYADAERAGTIAPEVLARAVVEGGGEGVLLDTWGKDGKDLLHWMPEPVLRAWVRSVRDRGRVTALAGGLKAASLTVAARCGADVLGVRGAVCEGGRDGTVRRELVEGVVALVRPRCVAPI